jgi:hypothetical protein
MIRGDVVELLAELEQHGLVVRPPAAPRSDGSAAGSAADRA